VVGIGRAGIARRCAEARRGATAAAEANARTSRRVTGRSTNQRIADRQPPRMNTATVKLQRHERREAGDEVQRLQQLLGA